MGKSESPVFPVLNKAPQHEDVSLA